MHPTFGRYELLKRIAGGGMGEVYLARQRGIDGFQKLVVIKTLLPHLCEDEEFITMFKDEARVTAQLIHPNICQVFEFDQAGGVYYMAMEYLRGEDLRRLWRACDRKGTPLRVPLICRVVADAAAGLDFAHSLRDAQGQPYRIVHRDISPQNILVTFEGGVKIIDFGVAKAAGRAQHTRTGALKGKYSYMSPEQVDGAELDGRSDIFALGIVLHELLTGRRLFKADSDVETLARVRECKVAPPSLLNPQLPAGLDALVLKSLARDPGARFRTAQEFRLAIEEWLIAGRMSASSAHLAEFLKTVYAERLDQEARLGPLLGEPAFSGPAPGSTPAGRTPSLPRDEQVRAGEPTARDKGAAVPSTMTPSRLPTESWVPAWLGGNRLRWSVVVLAAGVAVAGTMVMVIRPSRPTAAQEPPVAVQERAPVPQPAGPRPDPAGPRTLTITLKIEPAGTEIYEGSRLLGTSPHVWSGVAAGEHELTFAHAGYRESREKITVTRDEDITLRPLRKLEPARKQAPDLGIKAER